MADSEFEEFRIGFDTFPQSTNKSQLPFYSLVQDVDDDFLSSPSPKGDSAPDCDNVAKALWNAQSVFSLSCDDTVQKPTEIAFKKRRKLPEIPKNKLPINLKEGQVIGSEELFTSPDSDRLLTDPDSGHSTANSSSYSSINFLPLNVVSNKISLSPATALDTLEATHRGLNKFIPRHGDEISIEIGDPIYIQKECDDSWCEGINLRTGQFGIFPSAYAVDREYDLEASSEFLGHRERYCLGYLGSVETFLHKGTVVVCQAIKRILEQRSSDMKPHPCILEISDQGLRMVDRSISKNDGPCIDYFYSLKNVSFCAYHPCDHRFLGFITKHPTLHRFACHVFQGISSTRDVAEAVGRAFQRFYQKYIETAYPIEDIYIE